MKQLHKWIGNLLASLDEHVNEDTRVKVLETCGRSCISQSFLKKAKACHKKAKDVTDFLEKFSEIYSHLHIDQDNVYVVYPKCYCSLVRDHPGGLSPSWCYCSQGWVKELFESVLERPIQVELEKSIVRGDECCRLRVYI